MKEKHMKQINQAGIDKSRLAVICLVTFVSLEKVRIEND